MDVKHDIQVQVLEWVLVLINKQVKRDHRQVRTKYTLAQYVNFQQVTFCIDTIKVIEESDGLEYKVQFYFGNGTGNAMIYSAEVVCVPNSLNNEVYYKLTYNRGVVESKTSYFDIDDELEDSKAILSDINKLFYADPTKVHGTFTYRVDKIEYDITCISNVDQGIDSYKIVFYRDKKMYATSIIRSIKQSTITLDMVVQMFKHDGGWTPMRCSLNLTI